VRVQNRRNIARERRRRLSGRDGSAREDRGEHGDEGQWPPHAPISTMPEWASQAGSTKSTFDQEPRVSSSRFNSKPFSPVKSYRPAHRTHPMTAKIAPTNASMVQTALAWRSTSYASDIVQPPLIRPVRSRCCPIPSTSLAEGPPRPSSRPSPSIRRRCSG